MTQQSNLRRYVPVAGLLLFAVYAVMLLSGCSQSVTSPRGTNEITITTADGGRDSKADTLPTISPAAYDTILTYQADTTGGNFKLDKGNDKLIFQLSGRSLSYQVLLTIHVRKTYSEGNPFWELTCGPSGTVFAKALTVRVISPDLKKSDIALKYFNPGTQAWELQQVVGKTFPVDIFHFSKYGISMYSGDVANE